MFCPNCGQPVKETEKFCQYCGTRIEHPETAPQPEVQASVNIPEEQPQVVPPTYTQPTEPQPAPKKSHKALWITLICVGVALIAAVVALLLWHPWNRPGSRTDPNNGAEITEPAVITEPDATPSPEDVLRASFEKMQNIRSMHLDMVEDVGFEIVMEELNYRQGMDLQIEMAMDMQYHPMLSRSEVTMNGMGMSQSALTYTEEVDGVLRSYASADGGKTWSSSTTDATNMIKTPAESLEATLKNVKDLEKTGTEQVDGRNTTLYAGMLSGAYINDVLGTAGGDSTDMLAAFGIGEEYLKDLGDIRISFYLDDDGNLVRYAVDMTSMVQTVLTRAMEEQLSAYGEMNMEYNVTKAIVDCRVSQVNAVPPIEIPAEAKGEKPENTNTGTSTDDGIVGTWELTGGVGEEAQQSVALMLAFGMKMEFTFNADGTGSSYIAMGDDVEEEPFSYTLENGQIVIDGEGADYTLDGDTLTLNVEGEGMIFTRK